LAGGDKAKMVAIARYHRNPCYTPNLSSEPSIDNALVVHLSEYCASRRTAYPEISVSAEVTVPAGMLDGQKAIEQEFDFGGDPIPINATDLFIQVAYRGPLGDESDGIAVGIMDVSEPSYLGNISYTDGDIENAVSGSGITWSTWKVPFTNGEGDITHIEICQEDWQIYASTQKELLPENHVTRIAMLRDNSTHVSRIQVSFVGFNGPSTIGTVNLPFGQRQAMDERGNAFEEDLMSFVRGAIVGSRTPSNDIAVGASIYDFLFGSCPQNGDANAFCNPPIPIPNNDPFMLPPIKPPAAGFVSEPIGVVHFPGEVACTLVDDFEPYRRPFSFAQSGMARGRRH